MSRDHCEICGQPIRNIDFYLAIKGGVLCPSCTLVHRSVLGDERREPDGRAQLAVIAANCTSPERMLFF